MQLNPNVANFSDLIFGEELRVPNYQRSYVWKKKQFEKLILEIFLVGQPDKPKSAFLGPLVLLEHEKTSDIVDGQQRLTTLVMVLATFATFSKKNFAAEPIKLPSSSAIGKQLKLRSDLSLEDGIQSLLGKSSTNGGTFFRTNSEIRKIFGEAFLDGGVWKTENFWDRAVKRFPEHHAEIKNLQAVWRGIEKVAHTQLLDELKSASSTSRKKQIVIRRLEFILEKVQFLKIGVANRNDALTLFQTLNDRGLQLKPADLIRAFLFEQIFLNSRKDENFTDRDLDGAWREAISCLRKEHIDFNQFLRHWLMARGGGQVREQDIVDLVKKEMVDEKHSVQQMVDEIKDAAECYRNICYPLGTSQENRIPDPKTAASLWRMRHLGDSHRILTLRIIGMFRQAGKRQMVREAILDIERFVFRNAAVDRLMPQQVENIFWGAAQKIKNGTNAELQAALRELKGKLDDEDGDVVSKLPTPEEVEAALLENPPMRNSGLTRYVMELYCHFNQNDQLHKTLIFDSSYQVEHLAPQKPAVVRTVIGAKEKTVFPKEYWYDALGIEVDESPAEYSELVLQWGNLTLWNARSNASLKDLPWEYKRGGFPGKKNGLHWCQIKSNVQLAQRHGSWSVKEIDSRTRLIVSNVSKF